MATTTNSFRLGIKDFNYKQGSINWSSGSAISYKWKSGNTLNLNYTLTKHNGDNQSTKADELKTRERRSDLTA